MFQYGDHNGKKFAVEHQHSPDKWSLLLTLLLAALRLLTPEGNDRFLSCINAPLYILACRLRCLSASRCWAGSTNTPKADESGENKSKQ